MSDPAKADGALGVDAKGANVAQLRAAIDSGATADKVPALDPAAAPLGTDDEAAGTPPSPETVARALAAETRPHLAARQDPNRAQPADTHAAPSGYAVPGGGGWAIKAVLIGVAAALILGAVLMFALR